MNSTEVGELKLRQVSIWSLLKARAVEIAAVAFWFYAITQLFIFNIDQYIIEKVHSSLAWLINYKFLLVLGILSLLLILVKTIKIFGYAAFVALYPFFILFWRIPQFIWRQKSWVLTFAILNAGISLFKNLKFTIISFSVFLIAFVVAIEGQEKHSLQASIVVLLGSLALFYINTFKLVFQPSSVLQVYSKYIKRSPSWMGKVVEKELSSTTLPVEQMTEQQVQKRATTVQTLLLSNRVILFLARRLREYQSSQFSAISFTLNLVILLFVTVIAFSAINISLYKISSSEFSLTEGAHFFLFLYYSFHLFLFGSISELSPIGFWSRSISMSEQFFGIILIFIFISLLFSVRRDRYRDELEKTIRDAENAGVELEAMIETNYRLNIAQAFEEIRRLKNNALNIIVWLSKDL